MEPITAALAAGAAAGITGVTTQAIQDTYAALISALRARFPGVSVEPLEERPSSPVKQASLAEDLKGVGADRDAELVQLAQALVETIEREAPQAATSAGVDLQRVKAQFLNVQRITGSVRIGDAEMTGGGINVTDIGRGGGPDPNS